MLLLHPCLNTNVIFPKQFGLLVSKKGEIHTLHTISFNGVLFIGSDRALYATMGFDMLIAEQQPFTFHPFLSGSVTKVTLDRYYVMGASCKQFLV